MYSSRVSDMIVCVWHWGNACDVYAVVRLRTLLIMDILVFLYPPPPFPSPLSLPSTCLSPLLAASPTLKKKKKKRKERKKRTEEKRTSQLWSGWVSQTRYYFGGVFWRGISHPMLWTEDCSCSSCAVRRERWITCSQTTATVEGTPSTPRRLPMGEGATMPTPPLTRVPTPPFRALAATDPDRWGARMDSLVRVALRPFFV